MSLYRVTLRSYAVKALKEADTIAQDRVHVGFGLLAPLERPAIICVQTPFDRAESLGPNSPQYVRTATLAIRGFVRGNDAEIVLSRLDTLADQVERALFASEEFMSAIRQIARFETEMMVTLEGDRPIGELRIAAELEYDDAFHPGQDPEHSAGAEISHIDGRVLTSFGDLPFDQNFETE